MIWRGSAVLPASHPAQSKLDKLANTAKGQKKMAPATAITLLIWCSSFLPLKLLYFSEHAKLLHVFAASSAWSFERSYTHHATYNSASCYYSCSSVVRHFFASLPACFPAQRCLSSNCGSRPHETHMWRSWYCLFNSIPVSCRKKILTWYRWWLDRRRRTRRMANTKLWSAKIFDWWIGYLLL